MTSVLNLIRLLLAALLLTPVFFLNKEKAVFLFLRFAGPSFIKLGQLLSARPDLVGAPIANALGSFQDNLAPFCKKLVKKILANEFKEKLLTLDNQAEAKFDRKSDLPSYKKNFEDSFKQIFCEFDFEPVACASIAQVHRAKLCSGEMVAVKILRPKIHRIVARDIATVALVAFLSRFFFKSFNDFFVEIHKLLQQAAKYELNLLREAANGSQLRENLQKVNGFYVPKIFWHYSTTKVLVLEWIDGIRFSNSKAIHNSGFSLEKIASNLAISYFHQVYIDGFFHADMHPGNLLLMKNGDIAAIDFGIIGKIDRKTRFAIAQILMAFMQRDYLQAARLHIEAGLVGSEADLSDLALSCRIIGETVVGVDVRNISFAKLLANLIDMTFTHQMRVRPDLLLLQKTLLLVEGVGVELNPSLNMWDLARPWISEWAKNNIGFDYQMLDAAKNLLAKAKKFFL